MITLVEALNYRSLRYVARPLSPFHVLVGPNASGKTTFLDVIGFLGDVVSNGLENALADRAPDPRDLLFRRQGTRLELAVEAAVPDQLRQLALNPSLDTVRYQVTIGFDDTDRQFEFKAETLVLRKKAEVSKPPQRELFPELPPSLPVSLQVGIRQRDNKVLINKVFGGNDNFYNETKRSDRSWAPSFRLGPMRSALGNLPADEASFPIATWFRQYLGSGIQRFMLNSREIRQPSPPTRVAGFLPDGSNLSWVVARLRENDPDRHQAWIRHLRTALPDLIDIKTIERPEDRHCYMTYEYAGGLSVPSWLVSDGTLRLTALTLPAYLADLRGVYLIEEPENGIHPGAVAAVYDSLRSVYAAQVLLATHSPVVLSVASTADVLCFAKDENGATDIVLGSEHPRLRGWQEDADLGTLLASGVLG
ncbi:MAG: ATP-binding protein [Acidobacteria bacterium]|nr:ATP-binding protein [Acidobacteriota bacterium]MXZ72616.1 ATP-binding protein [Acidobacteriota bacterium]MYJ03793.1 ATP-binding protein [Acidobacteriota bacterium]